MAGEHDDRARMANGARADPVDRRPRENAARKAGEVSGGLWETGRDPIRDSPEESETRNRVGGRVSDRNVFTLRGALEPGFHAGMTGVMLLGRYAR